MSAPTAAELERLDEAERLALAGRLAYRTNPYLDEALDFNPVQEAFLWLLDEEIFYGGAGGGGKTYALFGAALQYVDVPGYNAILFRETYEQLADAGQLIPIAHACLDHTDAHWHEGRKRWTFPSGATVSFGYIANARQAHRRSVGPSYHFEGFDELTSLEEEWYVNMRTRLRRPAEPVWDPTHTYQAGHDGMTADQVPLRLRGASNPGGPGHGWCELRFVSSRTRPRGVRFLPATINDNPKLDRESYERTLDGLSPVRRAQIKLGDWRVRLPGTKFDPAWFTLVDRPRAAPLIRVRYWDLAGTELSETSPDPDWTVGTLLSWNGPGTRFRVEDVVRGRWTPGDVEDAVKRAAAIDGRSVKVGIEVEPGQSGKSQLEHYARTVLPGYVVKGWRVNTGKAERADAWSSAAEHHLIEVVQADWTISWLAEHSAFGQPGVHDDQVDSSVGAHWLATRSGPARVAKPPPRKAPARAAGQLTPRRRR